MLNMVQDAPAASTGWVASRFVAVILGMIALALLGARIITLLFGMADTPTFYLLACALPIVVLAPFALYFIQQHQQKHIACNRLDALAATDDETGMLNRRAFTLRVNARLQDALHGKNAEKGALLVIMADQIRTSDRKALLAAGLKTVQDISVMLRTITNSGDYVAHFGDGQFVIYLSQADDAQAYQTAIRIGTTIAGGNVMIGEHSHQMSASIGGAMSASHNSFATLYRTANERCDAASAAGGNRALLDQVHTKPLMRAAARLKTRKAA